MDKNKNYSTPYMGNIIPEEQMGDITRHRQVGEEMARRMIEIQELRMFIDHEKPKKID